MDSSKHEAKRRKQAFKQWQRKKGAPRINPSDYFSLQQRVLFPHGGLDRLEGRETKFFWHVEELLTMFLLPPFR